MKQACVQSLHTDKSKNILWYNSLIANKYQTSKRYSVRIFKDVRTKDKTPDNIGDKGRQIYWRFCPTGAKSPILDGPATTPGTEALGQSTIKKFLKRFYKKVFKCCLVLRKVSGMTPSSVAKVSDRISLIYRVLDNTLFSSPLPVSLLVSVLD